MKEQTGRPRNDGEPAKPYSQVHANMLFDLENRTYQDCILQPKASANERDAAIDMLKRLDVGKYIVIMDRGYDGFNMIENCNRIEDCYYVIRTKAGYGGIKEIANLPDKECDVEMDFYVTTSNAFYMQNKEKCISILLIAQRSIIKSISHQTLRTRDGILNRDVTLNVVYVNFVSIIPILANRNGKYCLLISIDLSFL